MKNAGHVLLTMCYYYYKMPSRFGNAPRGLRAIRYTYTGSRGRNLLVALASTEPCALGF